MARRTEDIEPHGRYRADEVGRLAGVSGARIGQWARHGYIRSSHSQLSPRIYAFQDVAEAVLVHFLLDEGVPGQSIRNTIKSLRQEHGDWPLQHAKLLMPAGASDAEPCEPESTTNAGSHTAVPPRRGKRALHHQHGKLMLDSTKTRDQIVAPDITSSLVKVVDVLSQGGWVAQDHKLEHIQVDPFRMSGQPSIRNRRITVEDVVRIFVESNGDRRLLRDDYGLTSEQIEDALTWWRATERLALAA
jgi:uncharacterized protein (DUF433 family)/DNA-binding transcriptional MerR regulator